MLESKTCLTVWRWQKGVTSQPSDDVGPISGPDVVVVPEGGGQLPVGIVKLLLLALDDEIKRIAIAVGRRVAPVQVDYTSRLGRGLT